MKTLIEFIVAGTVLLLSGHAFAQNHGSVKVECWGYCEGVDLGQICDTYVADSQPVSVACDDTSVGAGTSIDCGSATCRPYGSLVRSDLLSAYCDDGGGYDAVVTCSTSSEAAQPANGKQDDGGQQSSSRDQK